MESNDSNQTVPPNPPNQTGHMPIERDLDVIVEHASADIAAAYSKREFQRILRASLPLVALVPLFYLLTQLAYWNSGGHPRLAPALAVVLVAVGLPVLFAWIGSREARRRAVARSHAMGRVDEQLALEGRLQAADDFVHRPLLTGFEIAAIEDAAKRTEAARTVTLEHAPAQVVWGRASKVWAAAGVLGILVSLWVGTFEMRARLRAPQVDETLSAAAGDAAQPLVEEPTSAPIVPELPEPAALESLSRTRQGAAKPDRAEASPDISESVKESAGKTGAGRSSGALSSSAGSESRSAPSAQGQTSEPGDPDKKAKPSPKKKPKAEEEEPAPEETPEDEESGATAGKGSSKGSNKNPTASDWKSRDQVTESDDQEIEDDEEAEDDEESQENRGGVQPNLRDRRPPVSRDLQIGFGNRPNPDANGRGGPSEQKKSRGVASLVLGVPIPDRIKGRPGPGPTKITQERIEPQAEEAGSVAAAARGRRSSSTGPLGNLDLEPGLRALVRRYFLNRRATP